MKLLSGDGKPDLEGLARIYAWPELGGIQTSVVETLGTNPCGGGGCEELAREILAADKLCSTGVCRPLLIGTEGGGDVVWATANHGDLKALLGEIDTAHEAALLAWLQGHPLNCDYWGSGQQPRVEADGEGGFHVFYSVDNCSELTDYELYVSPTGEVTEVSRTSGGDPGCVEGRQPEGLRRARPAQAQHGGALGAHLSRMATMEAASVVSFVRIARELELFGADRSLVDAALSAAADEVRHARDASALCRHFGGHPEPAQVDPASPRDPWAFALDNAVEGCVRETYGALLGTYQAMTASDPLARATLTQIAEDETRHAQLSWRLAAFVEPRLSTAQRAALRQAQARAVVQLGTALDTGLSERERALIGYPDPATARALLGQLAAAVLS